MNQNRWAVLIVSRRIGPAVSGVPLQTFAQTACEIVFAFGIANDGDEGRNEHNFSGSELGDQQWQQAKINLKLFGAHQGAV